MNSLLSVELWLESAKTDWKRGERPLLCRNGEVLARQNPLKGKGD
jgi:hypothetical protein